MIDKDEIKKILENLEHAQRMLEQEKKTQKGIEEVFRIIEQSSNHVHNPESGLIAFVLREYRQHHETYKTEFHLYDAMSCINEAIGRITKLAEEPTPISEKIEALDEKPAEIKKGIAEEVSTKPTKKRKIEGTQITGEIARAVEGVYDVALIKENYLNLLNIVALHPNAKYDKIRKQTDFSANVTHACLRYGKLVKDIEFKKPRYKLTQTGITAFNELKKELGEDLVKVKNNHRANLEGTILTDSDALYIHMHYQTPVIKERYEKLLNILANAVGFKITVSEMVGMTGWSQNNTKAHLLYAQRKKEAVICGKRNKEYLYCLKKNLKKALPSKEVKASRMY